MSNRERGAVLHSNPKKQDPSKERRFAVYTLHLGAKHKKRMGNQKKQSIKKHGMEDSVSFRQRTQHFERAIVVPRCADGKFTLRRR